MAEPSDPGSLDQFYQDLTSATPQQNTTNSDSGLEGLLLGPLQSDQQLAQAQAQAGTFAAAVDSGELRMEAGVADEAAKICDWAVEELNAKIYQDQASREGPKLGDNEDGQNASATFVASYQAYIERIRQARTVVEQLAASFRKAGGLVAQTEETNVRGLSGGAE